MPRQHPGPSPTLSPTPPPRGDLQPRRHQPQAGVEAIPGWHRAFPATPTTLGTKCTAQSRPMHRRPQHAPAQQCTSPIGAMYHPAGTCTGIQVLPESGGTGPNPLVSATNVIPFTDVAQVQIPVHLPNLQPGLENPVPSKEGCARQGPSLLKPSGHRRRVGDGVSVSAILASIAVTTAQVSHTAAITRSRTPRANRRHRPTGKRRRVGPVQVNAPAVRRFQPEALPLTARVGIAHPAAVAGLQQDSLRPVHKCNDCNAKGAIE